MNYESQKKLQLREVIKSYFKDVSSTPYHFYSDLEDELNLATNYHMEQQRKLENAKSLLHMNSTISSSFPYNFPYNHRTGSISSNLYGSSDLLSGCCISSLTSSHYRNLDTVSFSSGSYLEW